MSHTLRYNQITDEYKEEPNQICCNDIHINGINKAENYDECQRYQGKYAVEYRYTEV